MPDLEELDPETAFDEIPEDPHLLVWDCCGRRTEWAKGCKKRDYSAATRSRTRCPTRMPGTRRRLTAVIDGSEKSDDDDEFDDMNGIVGPAGLFTSLLLFSSKTPKKAEQEGTTVFERGECLWQKNLLAVLLNSSYFGFTHFGLYDPDRHDLRNTTGRTFGTPSRIGHQDDFFAFVQTSCCHFDVLSFAYAHRPPPFRGQKTAMAAPTKLEYTQRLFNHIVLPPQLPRKQDDHLEGIGHGILDFVQRACNELRRATGDEFCATWAMVEESIFISSTISGKNRTVQSLLQAFEKLHNDKTVVALYIKEQNAGLLLHRATDSDGSSHIVFEAFEASPLSEDVLAVADALLWTFPSRAVQIPEFEFFDENFKSSLATFLEKATNEYVPNLAAKANKAGVAVPEVRNPSRPNLITHMLLSLLEAIGKPAAVSAIEKRVRDDVSFGDGQIPWRRHPLWLVLRVAIRRQLLLMHGPFLGYAAYKILQCVILSDLLDNCVDVCLHPALVSLLQKKLARKLAKLERHDCVKDDTSEHVTASRTLIQRCASPFKVSLDIASRYLDDQLAEFKSASMRQIPRLPMRASDSEMHLLLPTSKRYLVNAALPFSKQVGYTVSLGSAGKQTVDYPSKNPALKRSHEFASAIIGPFNLILDARALSQNMWKRIKKQSEFSDAEMVCRDISASFMALVECLNWDDATDQELNNALLLEIFDLWAVLDAICIRKYKYFGEYRAMFTPDLLDVLQLPDIDQMHRLRRIQKHLYNRAQECLHKTKTIFCHQDKARSFASRFARACPALQALYEKIMAEQIRNRQAATDTWIRACAQYDNLSKAIAASDCECITSTRSITSTKKLAISQCTRCSMTDKRDKMKIKTNEDLLPDDGDAAMAIVFELDIPECFSIYRCLTWELATVCMPALPPKVINLRHLRTTNLTNFAKLDSKTTIELVSETKLFMQTHYKKTRMKCELSRVLLPLGGDFRLYDNYRNMWVTGNCVLTLTHHCPIQVPSCLRPMVMGPGSNPLPKPRGPSSYEIVASRLECPSTMSVHEFEALQRLLSGLSRRLLTMLVELGCSNINFSKEDAVVMLGHLTHQAGPMLMDGKNLCSPHDVCHTECLGVVHSFFLDCAFLDRLLDELEKRLQAIEKNWRETYLMELVISLLLRAQNLLPPKIKNTRLESLIQLARSTTISWVEALRQEVMDHSDGEASGRASMYAFKAALLCRRTFAQFTSSGSGEIPLQELSTFLLASIYMQQNLTVDANDLSATDQALVVRDVMMGKLLAAKVERAAKRHPTAMTEAVCRAIGLATSEKNGKRSAPVTRFDAWRQMPKAQNESWFSSVLHPDRNVSEDIERPQKIHLHLECGYLLVDGKTIGKLPDNIRDSADVKAILGHTNLLSYPSALPAMSHRLVTIIEGHRIHFGHRSDGTVTICSIDSSGHAFQYVPKGVFVDKDNVGDLPRGLLDDCCHWLKKATGQLEMRRNLTKWSLQPNDWILDIRKRQAKRLGDVLVDPLSATAQTLCGFFRGFEDVQRLTIFQSMKEQEPLSVELRHLELSFFMNENGKLECRELGAEIDANQDAGTLYGYRSMIVLRDVLDRSRRSIITPLGPLKWSRLGAHISVETSINYDAFNTGSGKAYARFDIDTTLGRLVCPPEPRLLFTKALLHAFTSFCLPDPLTGRTGEEEAIHTLLSGRLQPWVSLPAGCLQILGELHMLVPARQYYPPGMELYQVVGWDKNLPVCLQSDRYGRIVREIVRKASRLRPFQEAASSEENKVLDEMYEAWAERNGAVNNLEARGEVQRMRYECPRQDSEPVCPVRKTDGTYLSLGYVNTSNGKIPGGMDYESSTVFQICRMMTEKPSAIELSQKPVQTLCRWVEFGGYTKPWKPDLVPMSTLLNASSLKEYWGNIVQMCRATSAARRFSTMFTLACLAFAPNADLDGVRLLVAYTYMDALRAIDPPVHPFYRQFIFDDAMTFERLAPVLETKCHQFSADTVALQGKKKKVIEKEIERQRLVHDKNCREEITLLASKILVRLQKNKLLNAGDFQSPLVNVKGAIAQALALREQVKQNNDLSDYLVCVEAVVAPLIRYTLPPPASTESTPSRPAPKMVANVHKMPSLTGDLVKRAFASSLPPPPQLSACSEPGADNVDRTAYVQPKEYSELRSIIQPFLQSQDQMRRHYGKDLHASLDALEGAMFTAHMTDDTVSTPRPSVRDLKAIVSATQSCIWAASDSLKILFSENGPESQDGSNSDWFGSGVSGGHTVNNWLERGGLWPRVMPVSILELLRSTNKVDFGPGVKNAIIKYGELLTTLQRFSRLLRATLRSDERRVQEELANKGHTNWTTTDKPDWLLLEVDSNVMIREEQVAVAQAMIEPKSGSNAVFQLNMGKGKTSVILPMVLSILADQKQLARLIAPKALLLPTAQVLQSRLGGLVGREIRHVPFSRRLMSKVNRMEVVEEYMRLHRELANSGGAIIAAPEHILAFTLSGQQCFVDCIEPKVAKTMMSFDAHMREGFCRDVLDESDFTLAVRTQLVYPSGAFTAVDGAPFRWELIEVLLSLLEGHALDLAADQPHKINVVKRAGGGFPTIYILHDSIEDELNRRLTLDIVNGRVPFFRLISKQRAASPSKKYVSRQAMVMTKRLLRKALESGSSDSTIYDAAKRFSDTEAIASALFLVRGLLRHGILTTCLKRRWNVQYGLHPKRWPIAVPYEARGVPSERSEFGHPDVAITFTCLAFYYAGISVQQMRQGLDHILHHLDDPGMEYEKWSSGDGAATVPEELQHWNSINIDDAGQIEKLWKCLRFTRPVINHYLNTFVFPVYSRQFSVKLQASAWNLPLFIMGTNSVGPPAGARTTGFSGTNDNKAMLPLSITQQDLPALQQTNAEVLSYLLQPRNRSYICTGTRGKRWSEDDLVHSLAKFRIQVFIDAGAYILESTNEDLARLWLSIAETNVKAAVFFNEKDNRAWVVFRDATAAKAPLVSTPFAERLDECIVYFDEAHTRGVDLLLPPKARGALTLALGQTKDHTVQAAMRLRQLGTTQSVVFYAPPEVDQSIRDTCKLGNPGTTASVQSPHVVAWLLEQTCQANDQLRPLYTSHGLNYCRTAEALATYQNGLDNKKSRKLLRKVLVQPERQTLENMYTNDMSTTTLAQQTSNLWFLCLQGFAEQLKEQNVASGGNSSFASKGAFEEVEQEREVEVQVEQQRHVQKKTKFLAHKFPGVSPVIRAFVATGVLRESDDYESVFKFISQTDIGMAYGVRNIKTRLFVSVEFSRTVNSSFVVQYRHDDFMRPVEWLLWSPSTETGLVIIPEELEELIPDIRISKKTRLIAYSAAVTRSMLAFSSLDYFSFPSLPDVSARRGSNNIPSWLSIELGILAGRLYMTYDEAADFEQYLDQFAEMDEAVRDNNGDGDENDGGSDGDVIMRVTNKNNNGPQQQRLCPNLTSFLLEWLPLRRTAQDVLHTPAAYVCQGRTIRPDHPFFLQPSSGSGVPRVEEVTDEDSGDETASLQVVPKPDPGPVAVDNGNIGGQCPVKKGGARPTMANYTPPHKRLLGAENSNT